ncbi:hypothetical protein VKT23_004358 [Stygiomarasmius scandens]|uniref:Uncharacterized protein n=1 Tax=Marasmiellus scandens TaxID=2682957 RepID=A0ABR1JY77_9AGAR
MQEAYLESIVPMITISMVRGYAQALKAGTSSGYIDQVCDRLSPQLSFIDDDADIGSILCEAIREAAEEFDEPILEDDNDNSSSEHSDSSRQTKDGEDSDLSDEEDTADSNEGPIMSDDDQEVHGLGDGENTHSHPNQPPVEDIRIWDARRVLRILRPELYSEVSKRYASMKNLQRYNETNRELRRILGDNAMNEYAEIAQSWNREGPGRSLIHIPFVERKYLRSRRHFMTSAWRNFHVQQLLLSFYTGPDGKNHYIFMEGHSPVTMQKSDSKILRQIQDLFAKFVRERVLGNPREPDNVPEWVKPHFPNDDKTAYPRLSKRPDNATHFHLKDGLRRFLNAVAKYYGRAVFPWGLLSERDLQTFSKDSFINNIQLGDPSRLGIDVNRLWWDTMYTRQEENQEKPVKLRLKSSQTMTKERSVTVPVQESEQEQTVDGKGKQKRIPSTHADGSSTSTPIANLRTTSTEMTDTGDTAISKRKKRSQPDKSQPRSTSNTHDLSQTSPRASIVPSHCEDDDEELPASVPQVESSQGIGGSKKNKKKKTSRASRLDKPQSSNTPTTQDVSRKDPHSLSLSRNFEDDDEEPVVNIPQTSTGDRTSRRVSFRTPPYNDNVSEPPGPSSPRAIFDDEEDESTHVPSKRPGEPLHGPAPKERKQAGSKSQTKSVEPLASAQEEQHTVHRRSTRKVVPTRRPDEHAISSKPNTILSSGIEHWHIESLQPLLLECGWSINIYKQMPDRQNWKRTLRKWLVHEQRLQYTEGAEIPCLLPRMPEVMADWIRFKQAEGNRYKEYIVPIDVFEAPSTIDECRRWIAGLKLLQLSRSSTLDQVEWLRRGGGGLAQVFFAFSVWGRALMQQGKANADTEYLAVFRTEFARLDIVCDVWYSM